MAKEKSVADIIDELREQSDIERKQSQGFRLQQSKADKDREKSENTRAEQANAIFRSISYDIKTQTKIADAQYKADKANRLDKLEAQRERVTTAKGALGKDDEKTLDKVKDIKEGFVKKITKLAFGIIGAGAFVLLVKNFGAIKTFVTEKVLPVIQGMYTFIKDTILPFVVDNFKEILMGIVGIAGVIVGAKIIKKIYDATKLLMYGFQVLQLNVMSVVSTISGGVMKAFNFMKKAFIFFRVTMLKEFIPTVIGSLRSAASSMGGGLMKALKAMQAAFLVFRGFMFATFIPGMVAVLGTMMTSLGAILLPFAPIIAIAALIALAVAAIGVALAKVRDAMGFESVFDVVMYGVYKIKDAFSMIANFYITVYNTILGFVKTAIKALGRFAPESLQKFAEDDSAGTIDKLDTNSAEKFKEEAQKRNKEKLDAAADKAKEEGRLSPVDLEEPPREREKERMRTKAASSGDSTADPFNRPSVYEQAQARAKAEGRIIPGANDEYMAQLSREYDERKAREKAQGGNAVAINAPSSVTNNSSSAMYSDPSPATDDLDRSYSF